MEAAHALHLDRSARLEGEAVAERLPHRVGHLNLAGEPVRLEPRGQIHRLAPDVVGEFVAADDARHERAAGDAGPDPEIDAVRGREPFDEIGQEQRHAGEPRQMVGLLPAHARDREIAVADGLDLLDAVRGREPVELGDDVVEHGDGALNAEPLGKLGEADEIGEEDGRLADAVGNLVVGARLQALGDRLGQDIGEKRIGLGAGAVGHGEGIAHDQSDDGEGGRGRGDVEIGEQRGVGDDARVLRREQEPGRDMQREPDRDHRNHETHAIHADDGEGDGGGDDEIDLNAGIVAELAHEEEQRDVFGEADEERRGDVADAMGERREQRDGRERDIDGDQRPVGVEAVGGEHEGIDHREDGDGERHQVDDREPPAHGTRMELRAELGEAAERTEPCEGRIAWAGGFAFAHGREAGNEVAGSYRSFSRGTIGGIRRETG